VRSLRTAQLSAVLSTAKATTKLKTKSPVKLIGLFYGSLYESRFIVAA